jgi:hypothetical protein
MTLRLPRLAALGLLLASCSGDVLTASGPRAGDFDDAQDPSAGDGDGDGQNGPVTSARVTLRRLTLSQYENSLSDLLGVSADLSRLSEIPPLNGLRAIGASSLALPERDVEVFDSLAETLSAQLFDDESARQSLVGCDAAQSACREEFVTRFGRRLFRRPLSDDERTRYLALLAEATEATEDGWLGLRVVMSALLQSPSFLYREETGEPSADDAKKRVLSGYELAARLSFFLWNSTPDDELLDAAESGLLDTSDGLTAQAERLLGSPKAAQASEELFSDYLRLDILDEMVKLPEAFPQATASLPQAMKRETLLTMRSFLFEQGGDFRSAFTRTETIANGELAALYGLDEPDDASAFTELSLPEDGARAGLLMQASFLASHSHPGASSATKRGKFVRENLLCQAMPPPPDDVDTSLPPPSEGAETARQRLTRHREDPACSGCHALMDPIGLAL